MTSAAIAIVVALSLAPPLSGADLERQARAIDAMLIAPCCFSQQVSVHQSPAADEVRRDVRARLAAGQMRQQILDAYVGQYGKRVLAVPPAAGFDLTLYVMPFALLIASLALVTAMVRRFTAAPAPDAAPRSNDVIDARTRSPLEDRLDDELRDLD